MKKILAALVLAALLAVPCGCGKKRTPTVPVTDLNYVPTECTEPDEML